MFASNTSQVSQDTVYIEDVFSTYLYTTNGTTQNIVNGIDLSGKGGLVWAKRRDASGNHGFTDTARGAGFYVSSNSTAAQAAGGSFTTAFNSNGFSTNASTSNFASWTFRKQAKFFDVVTYTGTGANQTISHNLGSVPGCIIIKRTDTISNWSVYHTSLGNTQYMYLNSTAAATTGTTFWNSTTPTSTNFSLGISTAVNNNGGTYVAYLFAHNAGGFGLTGTDNVISCGTYTGNLSADVNVTLGYEPQWILLKQNSAGQNWYIWDTMRGWSVGSPTMWLNPNLSNAETDPGSVTGYPTATGFTIPNGQSNAADYIYVAIRRGPMKTPTSGTSVFAPVLETPINGNTTVTAGFPVDLGIAQRRPTAGYYDVVNDRLRGGTNTYWASLFTQATNAEQTGGIVTGLSFQNNTGIIDANYLFNDRGWSNSTIWWLFGRAPGFMDVVCYTGTNNDIALTHNLGVAPEAIILKKRSSSGDWDYETNFTSTQHTYFTLNSTIAGGTANYSSGINLAARPTSTTVTVAGGAYSTSGSTYVMYLFASCPGVSKVGSYSGTGATQTISCGFAARFVMIKRTDSTGSWWVWDTTRGMVAGTDPRLALNLTDAETNANWVYTDASGFQIVTTDATVNANGGSYIYLAIA